MLVRAENLEDARLEYFASIKSVPREPKDYIQDWTLRAYIEDAEVEKINCDVAHVAFHRIKCRLQEEEPSNIFDAHSAYLYAFYDSFPDLCADSIEDGILFIHTCVIHPTARGHRLGQRLVKNIIATFAPCEEQLVVCKPYPMHSEEGNAITMDWLNDDDDIDAWLIGLEALRKYWSQIGFKRMELTDYYSLR